MTRGQFTAHVEAGQRAFRRFLTVLCCGDSQLADDVAQEAYIKAYLAADSLSDESKFNAWLYRIGYNTFINHRRSARPFDSIDTAGNISADVAADGSFRYQELYAALDKLPPKERTSVLLYYLQGYSIKEISDIVDASESAVKQHLSRGRNHLRGLITPQ